MKMKNKQDGPTNNESTIIGRGNSKGRGNSNNGNSRGNGNNSVILKEQDGSTPSSIVPTNKERNIIGRSNGNNGNNPISSIPKLTPNQNTRKKSNKSSS
jgi:hypothetical protein